MWGVQFHAELAGHVDGWFAGGGDPLRARGVDVQEIVDEIPDMVDAWQPHGPLIAARFARLAAGPARLVGRPAGSCRRRRASRHRSAPARTCRRASRRCGPGGCAGRAGRARTIVPGETGYWWVSPVATSTTSPSPAMHVGSSRSGSCTRGAARLRRLISVQCTECSTPSSRRISRRLRQPSPETSRSVPAISSMVRTIMRGSIRCRRNDGHRLHRHPRGRDRRRSPRT